MSIAAVLTDLKAVANVCAAPAVYLHDSIGRDEDARLSSRVEHKPSRALRLKPSPDLDRDTRLMILLNLYPITYVILMIPGMVNRLAEMMGHHFEWMVIWQSTTQLTGFANALVYGVREHRADIKRWLGWKQ
jgi:hypothetical protein